MKTLVDGLDLLEATLVLRAMLEEDDTLLEKIYETAMNVIAGFEIDYIADEVASDLGALYLDDVEYEDGRSRNPLYDSDDLAIQRVEQELEPYLNKMKQNQKRGLPEVAKNHCIGIIRGIRQFEEDSDTDPGFKELIVDGYDWFVNSVVREWKKAKPSKKDVAEVMAIAKASASQD